MSTNADEEPRRFGYIERVPECEGQDPPDIYVHLTLYTHPEKARSAVMLMCANLRGAMNGVTENRRRLAAAWLVLLVEGLAIARQDSMTKFAALCNIHGSGRVIDAMNRNSLAALGEPDLVAMADEALGRPLRQDMGKAPVVLRCDRLPDQG